MSGYHRATVTFRRPTFCGLPNDGDAGRRRAARGWHTRRTALRASDADTRDVCPAGVLSPHASCVRSRRRRGRVRICHDPSASATRCGRQR